MFRPVIFCLGIVVSLAVGESPAVAQAGSPEAAGVRIVITGTIRNFDELAALVVPESYVQLVRVSADDSYSFVTDEHERFSYVSDLPKVSPPTGAAFSFVVPDVPPGRYLLAAQRLKAQPDMAGQRPWFETDSKKKKRFVVEVSAKAKGTVEVEAGRLVVSTR